MLRLFLLGLLTINVAYGDDEQEFALKFLNQYQYISQSRSGNHDVPTAIKNFQSFFGLPVTGELDPDTLALMHKPRCGMPDVDESGLRVRRYDAKAKWAKTDLTYYIEHGRDLEAGVQNGIFKNALKFWSDKSTLTFRRVLSGSEADIKISFGRHSHGGTHVEGQCPYPFDGPGGVLAHAYFPSDGRAHFDEDEYFTHQSQNGVNLMWVAAHEFGHSLGLGHSSVGGALMYPYYTGYKPGMQLHSDDIAGIQSLYGANTGGGGGSGTVAPTNKPNCNDRMENCKVYVDNDYCKKYPDNMKYWCQNSCSFCT